MLFHSFKILTRALDFEDASRYVGAYKDLRDYNGLSGLSAHDGCTQKPPQSLTKYCRWKTSLTGFLSLFPLNSIRSHICNEVGLLRVICAIASLQTDDHLLKHGGRIVAVTNCSVKVTKYATNDCCMSTCIDLFGDKSKLGCHVRSRRLTITMSIYLCASSYLNKYVPTCVFIMFYTGF